MKSHLPGLEVQRDGTVIVDSEENLASLLACPVTDLSTEMVMFVARQWLDRDDEERAKIATFLNSAREQVCNEGRLPEPHTQLPPVGIRVEAVVTSRKPGPECGYGMGTVTGHEWCSVSRDWRVDVTFDEAAGTYYGMPINGTSTFPDLVHVIGSPGRAFSSMTPDEIDPFLEARSRQRD